MMKRTKLALALAVVGPLACSKATPTEPTTATPNCTFTVTLGPISCGHCGVRFPSRGGSSTANVFAASACSWSAVSDVDWITGAPQVAAGNGTVTIAVGANRDARRVGHLVVAGTSIDVAQAGATPCGFSVAPLGVSLSAAGGAASVDQAASSSGCYSTVSTNVGWITVPNPIVYGNSVIRFSVAANLTGSTQRSGTLIVAPCGGTDDADCDYNSVLPPFSVTVTQAGSP